MVFDDQTHLVSDPGNGARELHERLGVTRR
jgi:hypothetical protein